MTMPIVLQILLAAFGANLIVGAATQKTEIPPQWYLVMSAEEQGEWHMRHNFKYHLRYGLEAKCSVEVLNEEAR
jgi:hypothetical protein